MKNYVVLAILMLLGGLFVGMISAASPTHSLHKENKLDVASGNAAPAMVFPVAGKKARVGSFWGAIRDGGARKHEGIDIFAAKKTPVLAVTDGIVTTIGNGGRGGKYVWLKGLDDNYTYYYAHLDKQLVQPGQSVKKGQVIGTVGNTGNAKLTPPHLHFGMYSYSGAVDPYPFVKNSRRLAAPLAKPAAAEALAKKDAQTPPNHKMSLAASPITRKNIWKTLKVPADPAAQYYITVRSNVVRVHNNELDLIGKYEKVNSSTYPYRILLLNQRQLRVHHSGRVLASGGQVVGEVI